MDASGVATNKTEITKLLPPPPPCIELPTESMNADPEALTWRQKLAVSCSLGSMAVFGYTAEQAGLSQKLIEPFRAVAESVAHPVLGYVATSITAGITTGAAGSERLQRSQLGQRIGSWLGKHAWQARLVAATVANFATETAQMLLIGHGPNANFLASGQLFETAKDYVFALGGVALYFAHNRYQQKKQGARVESEPTIEALAA